PKRLTPFSRYLKYRYLGISEIPVSQKILAPRHPSEGPAGQAIAFQTQDSLSREKEGVGEFRRPPCAGAAGVRLS
ncbi:MAG: hypothetical protein ACK55Z_14405, partial [bacterium]